MPKQTPDATASRDVRARLGGLLRVALLLLAAALLSGGWLVLRARAQLGERALVLGRSAAQALRDHPGTTPLTINGQRLSLDASSTQQPIGAVLDRFAALCARVDGGMQSYLDGLRSPRAERLRQTTWSQLTLFRNQHEAEGTAACIARDPSDAPFTDLVARLAASVEHADLARLGQFRYVFARTSPVTGLTHVVSVWSRGPLKLLEMVPDGSDVPGGDLVRGVRPDKSVRVVRAQADGTGFEASLYESPNSAPQTLASYDAALRARGYVPLLAPHTDSAAPVPVRAYAIAGRDPLLAIALPTEQGSLLTAFRIGANGTPALDR
jgi:hypothetical protein